MPTNVFDSPGWQGSSILENEEIWQKYIALLLVIAILLVGNHRTIMKGQRLSLLHNTGLVLIILILLVSSILFFYQLATRQGS